MMPKRPPFALEQSIFEQQQMGEPPRRDADHFRPVFEPAMRQNKHGAVVTRLNLEHHF
jgi:hypothetical protein